MSMARRRSLERARAKKRAKSIDIVQREWGFAGFFFRFRSKFGFGTDKRRDMTLSKERSSETKLQSNGGGYIAPEGGEWRSNQSFVVTC